MKHWKEIAATFGAALLLVALAAPAMAALEDQRTEVTINQPVELPGMVLPAGDYTFELLESSATNQIVEIRRADGTVLNTVLTVPNKRMEPTGDTVFRFYETASNTPPALRVWFYPGMEYGHEFVYPESRAMELAQESGRDVPSSSDANYATKPASEDGWTALRETHIVAVKPSGEKTDTETAARENEEQDRKVWDVYHYYSVTPIPEQ